MLGLAEGSRFDDRLNISTLLTEMGVEVGGMR